MITHQSKPRSITAIKTAAKRAGSHFFDKSTMREWSTYLPSQTWQGKGSSTVFVTADRFDDDAPHVYTLRRSLYTGRVDTIDGYERFAKLGEAKQAAAELSESEREQW